MGASVSKNVSNAVTKAVAKVSSNIIQNTQLSQDMAQVVSVRDVHGDVHISGNTFTQHATVNMHTLLDALSTEEAQQSIMQELAQEAKSVTSDLNIGQFSDAQNTITNARRICRTRLSRTWSLGRLEPRTVLGYINAFPGLARGVRFACI